MVCPIITDHHVAIKPSKGPNIIPFIGLSRNAHPYHTPAEKPGVTTESKTIVIAANIVIIDMRFVFDIVNFKPAL